MICGLHRSFIKRTSNPGLGRHAAAAKRDAAHEEVRVQPGLSHIRSEAAPGFGHIAVAWPRSIVKERALLDNLAEAGRWR